MVSKRTLLLIAGLVWLAAGVNILRIGLKALIPLFSGGTGRLALALVLALLICAAFSLMFHRIVVKHTARSLSYETKQPAYRFFDVIHHCSVDDDGVFILLSLIEPRHNVPPAYREVAARPMTPPRLRRKSP